MIAGKLNDFESKKGEPTEKAVNEMYTSICNEEGVSFQDMCTGLCVIMGNYYLCLIQTEDDLYLRFVLEELQKNVGKGPYLENAWVLHFQEEVPESHFREWTCKQMPASGMNKEIKNWNQFERLSHLYSNMLSLGDAVMKALDSEKSFSQIAKLIKDTAVDNLPTGEELNSAL